MEARSISPCAQQNNRPRQHSRSFICNALLLCLLILFLGACAKVPAKKGGGDITPTTTAAHTLTPTPTSKPITITLQVVGCPAGLSINWDKLVGTTAQVNKVQKVTCGSLEGNGSVEALVNVRYYSSNNRLDYYVYDNLLGTPQQRFKMLNLLDGDARISPSNTIMTAEIGSQDTLKGAPDVFKEFQWNGAGFAQISFPGMYPDATYYQAEQDQAQLNAEFARGEKRNAWKIAFYGVVDQLAKDIFHWTDTHTTTIRFRSSTSTYIAAVYNLGLGGGGFVATMFHLDNSEANIFEVMQITSIDGSASLNSPAAGTRLANPLTVSGVAPASGSILGKVVVYNDTFTAIGDSGSITSAASSGSVNFSKTVHYQLNSSSIQEGMVAFFATNLNNTNYINQVVMVKVLLGP